MGPENRLSRNGIESERGSRRPGVVTRALRALVAIPLVAWAAQAAGVSVALNPVSASLNPGGSASLAATVSGTANTAVTWTVDGIANGNGSVGTITPQGGTPVVRQIYHTAATKVQSGVNVVAGDLVCVGWQVGNSPGGANTSCSDSSGNTYSEVGGTGSSGYSYSASAGTTLYQFYTIAATTNPSLTITLSSLNTNSDDLFVAVVQGMSSDPATVLDAFANSADSGLVTSHTSGTLTTTCANDFLFSIWGNDQIDGILTEGASGFTIAVANNADAACTRIAGAAGSYSETMTSSAAMQQVNVLAAFKAGAGHAVTYTAPATGGSHTIVATSVADATQSASAVVSVGSGVTVSLSPVSANLGACGSTALTATVTGSANTAVTWTVDGVANGNATVGTLTPQPSTPAVRQTYHATATKTQSGVSVMAGDLICVGWQVDNSPGDTSCSDSSGNTYTEVGGTGTGGCVFSSSAGSALYQFYAIAGATNPSLTLTITSVNTNSDDLFVAVVKGMSGNPATVLDAFASSVDAGLVTSHTSGSLATASANDFLFGTWGNGQIGGVLTEGASGFTIASTNGANAMCYKFAGAPGSYSETLNSSAAMQQLNFLSAFKAAVGNTVNYTAPLVGGAHAIVATSVADPAQSASAVATSAAALGSYPVFGPAVHPVFAVGASGNATLQAATDPNHSPLAYQVSGLPAGLSFDSSSRVISGTLAVAGTYTFTYNATNGFNLTTSTNVSVVAAYPPVLGAPIHPTFLAGIPGHFTLPAASDPNGSALSYQVSAQLPGLTFDASSRVVSGTLSLASGPSIAYIVTNALGLATTGTIPITVVPATNPVLGSAPTPVFQAGVAGSFTLPEATDPYGTPLSYQVSNLPSGLVFDPGARVVSGTLGTLGSYRFDYQVTDAYSLTSTGSITVEVASPPAFGQLPGLIFRVGIPGGHALPPAADPNGSPLSYQVAGLPAGLTFNSSTLVISGTAAGAGTYALAYTARDGYGLVGSATVNLAVKALVPSQMSIPRLTTSYGYDSEGRLQTLTYPDNTQLTYGYDSVDRVNQVTRDGQTIVRNIDYDAWSNLKKITFLSQAAEQWDYDATGTRYQGWSIAPQGGTPIAESYGYDSIGRLNQACEWDSLQYDANSRLISATGYGGWTNTLVHDAYGNNISSFSKGNVPNSQGINYTFNPEVDNRIPGVAATGGIVDVDWSDFGEITKISSCVNFFL